MADRFIKLVRDKVGAEGDEAIYKRAPFSAADFHWALANKLEEEAKEYKENRDWSELIDAYEVIWALTELHGKTIPELMHDAEVERLKRGSFLNRMSLWIRRKNG